MKAIEVFLTKSSRDAVWLKAISAFFTFWLIWLILYIVARRYVHGSRQQGCTWALKATSICHAVFTATLSIWALCKEPGTKDLTSAVVRFDASAARPLARSASEALSIGAPVTMAYFVFDLLLMPVWEGTLIQWIPVFFHHGLPLIIWPLGLRHSLSQWFILWCLTLEFSTPFVQLRWFIKLHRGKESTLYKINGMLMTFTFFLCRIFVLPHLFWAIYVSIPHSITAPDLPWHLKLACASVVTPHMLNLHWGWLLLKGLLGVLRGKKDTKHSETTKGQQNVDEMSRKAMQEARLKAA